MHYSASAKERDTVGCFFDLKEIKESPMKLQKPLIDNRVWGQATQSTSEKIFSWRAEILGKKMPCPIMPLI